MTLPEPLALKSALDEYIRDPVITVIPQLSRSVERITVVERCINSLEKFQNGETDLEELDLDYDFLKSGNIYAVRHAEFQNRFEAYNRTYLVTKTGYVLCLENSLRVLRENLSILEQFVGTQYEKQAFFVIHPLKQDLEWVG